VQPLDGQVPLQGLGAVEECGVESLGGDHLCYQHVDERTVQCAVGGRPGSLGVPYRFSRRVAPPATDAVGDVGGQREYQGAAPGVGSGGSDRAGHDRGGPRGVAQHFGDVRQQRQCPFKVLGPQGVEVKPPHMLKRAFQVAREKQQFTRADQASHQRVGVRPRSEHHGLRRELGGRGVTGMRICGGRGRVQ